MREEYLRITEFARLARTSRKTLQYYDELGLFRPACVEANGYRYYTLHQLDRLALIAVLRDMGLPLKEIRAYLDGGGAQLDRLLEAQRDRIDGMIEQLQYKKRLLKEVLEENRTFQSLCGKGSQLVKWPPQRAARLVDVDGGRLIANYLTNGLHLGLCAFAGGEFLYQKREDGELLIPGGTFFCKCELIEAGPQKRCSDWVERMGASAAQRGLTLAPYVYLEYNDLLPEQSGNAEFMMRLARSPVVEKANEIPRRAGDLQAGLQGSVSL